MIFQHHTKTPLLAKSNVYRLGTEYYRPIPDLGEVSMEAAILAHVHPLGSSFGPGGGQALPLPTVNLLTLYSILLMIALEIHQLN